MNGARPGRGSDQFPLRLPDGMRDRLKAEADKGGRSMNAEIVKRLEESLDETQLMRLLPEGRSLQPTDPLFLEGLDAIRAKIDEMQRRYALLFSDLDKDEIQRVTGTLDEFNRNMNKILEAGIPLENVFPNTAKTQK